MLKKSMPVLELREINQCLQLLVEVEMHQSWVLPAPIRREPYRDSFCRNLSVFLAIPLTMLLILLLLYAQYLDEG